MFQTTSEPSWYAAYSSSSAQYAEKQSTCYSGSPTRPPVAHKARIASPVSSTLKYQVVGASPVPVQIWQE